MSTLAQRFGGLVTEFINFDGLRTTWCDKDLPFHARSARLRYPRMRRLRVRSPKMAGPSAPTECWTRGRAPTGGRMPSSRRFHRRKRRTRIIVASGHLPSWRIDQFWGENCEKAVKCVKLQCYFYIFQRIFVVMFFNFLLSNIFATTLRHIEKPSQVRNKSFVGGLLHGLKIGGLGRLH